MLKRIIRLAFSLIDPLYRKIDKKFINRTKNIRRIPGSENRRGGKVAYSEWAHVIGIFQTMMYHILPKKDNNQILDIGCGTGLLGIAAEPFTLPHGTYTGIDVMTKDIDFCKKNYQDLPNYDFIHFDVANPMYASDQDSNLKPWPIADNSKDLVTALSVWTHLCEEDALFYLKEVARVLKPGAKAMITFFYLDDKYKQSLAIRNKDLGRFHSSNQMKWIFDQKAYKSEHWYCPKWTKNPEEAIAIDQVALDLLIKASGLKLLEYHSGNWKEQVGPYFQDILIFGK